MYMKGLGLTEQEQSVLARIQMFTQTFLNIDLNIEKFTGKKYWYYEGFINRHKREGFIGIKPPYIFNNRDNYNDFSVFLPKKSRNPYLEFMGMNEFMTAQISIDSFAIECKRYESDVCPNEISTWVYKRKNIPETKMYYIYEGNGFKNHNHIKSLMDKRSKVFFNVNDFMPN